MSKKLEEKQARREAEERKLAERRKAARRRNLITLLISLVVLGGVVAAIVAERQAESGPVGGSVAEARCSDIVEDEVMDNSHIARGEGHEPYTSDPPTSGPHYSAPDGPVDPGFYTNPLEPEAVVHNLEHGQIVFWYRDDISQETKDDLERVVEQESSASVALPYANIDESYSFVMTAWGRTQSCVQASQEVVDDFRSQFQGKGIAPEAGLAPPFEG